jgi:hypothetical protein
MTSFSPSSGAARKTVIIRRRNEEVEKGEVKEEGRGK